MLPAIDDGKMQNILRKSIDKTGNMDIIFVELHTSLIKSGGGNGPMKPGNLLSQGAKSGGKREMRIR